MVREILIWPDPRLKEKAKPVIEFGEELKRLVADMAETMYAAEGVGLAAPQIGVLQRVIVIDTSPRESGPGLIVLVNPELTLAEGEMTYSEGCLSIPGEYEEVERFARVKVKAQGVDGKWFELEGTGLLSVAIQHEMDHLEGILFVDRISMLKRELIKKRMKKLKAERERQRAEARSQPPAL